VQAPMLPKKQKCVEARGLAHVKKQKFIKQKEKSEMKSKMILIMLAILITVAGNAKAQDGSEYLLWEKTKDFTTVYVAFSPDETQIAVSAEYTDIYPHTYSIKIMSVLTGEELRSIPIPNLVYPIFYTTDGKYLVAQGNGETNIIFDAKTYAKVKELPAGGITFSADNNFLSLAVTGFKFLILNSTTFETVFEKDLTKPTSEEDGYYYVFFTPNGKYLVANTTIFRKLDHSSKEPIQEIFDAKSFLKLDITNNCLKKYGIFSNNGLLAITYPKEGSESTQPIGFRIYDYDKDSLIWEQETENYSGLIFLNTKNYLISRLDNYEEGNPDMKVFKTWNLETKQKDKDIFCAYKYNSKISKSDKYFSSMSITVSGSIIYLYDFEKMFEGNVAINDPQSTIEISIKTLPDSNIINIDQIQNNVTKISLYDISGNFVDSIYKGNPITNSIEYNTSHLSKGVYLVKIDTNKESLTKKIIIE
jgi:hypothetical protein